MKFIINDSVAVLDDDLSGIIINIDGSDITVATSTGFDLIFNSSELVKMKQNLMSSQFLEEYISYLTLFLLTHY